MRKLVIAAAVAVVPAAPAMANSLGCWNTTDIEPNNAQPGTYLNTASGAVDYISPGNEGVGMLFASLDSYDTSSFVICMSGSTVTQGTDTVWQPASAIICPSNVFTGGACPG